MNAESAVAEVAEDRWGLSRLFLVRNSYWLNFWLTLAYAVSGKMALMMAIPPGYSTPVFPPAGIALAAILLAGNRALPGIFFGSFVLNLWTSVSPLHTSTIVSAFILAAGIGTGALLQAFVANFVVKKYAKYPSPLIQSGEILKFLFWGGPVACLVNATWATTVLWMAHLISREIYNFTWWNWWVGDTMGVLVITPILFAFFALPKALWRKRRISIVIPLGVTIFLNSIVFFHADAWEQKSVRLEFERTADTLATQIRKSFEGYLDSLYALESVVTITDAKDRRAFEVAAERWYTMYPGIYAFAWIPRVMSADRKSFEANYRFNRDPNFHIQEMGPDGKLVKAAVREVYYPSTFVAPYQQDVTILGFDLATSPERNRAMLQARDSGKIAVTSPVKLIQNVADRFAIMAFLPLYHGDHSSVGTRRKNLFGFVNVVLRMGDVIEASTKSRIPMDLKLAVSNELFPSGQIYYSGLTPAAEAEFAKTDHLASPAMRAWNTRLALADRQYWLSVIPSHDYWIKQRDEGPWLILAAGLVTSGLLVAFLLAITGNSFAIERELAERKRMSDQLKRNSEELSSSNAELEQFAYVASHDLQEPLRVISIYIELLRKRMGGSLDSDAETFMTYVVDGAGRMRELIRDLLEYSRVGRTGAVTSQVEVKSVVDHVVRDLTISIAESKAEIIVSELPKLTIVTLEWVQLFQNLITNALKYRDKSRSPSIRITCEKKDGNWIFSVHDNGIGIAKEFTDRIFLVFQRLHGKSEFQGTGIGLAICKKIVEKMGGRIWVESQLGVGSIFRFSVPVEAVS